MSKRIEILPRLEGESLTDWTLRFLADGRNRVKVGQELWDYTRCTCENNGDYCEYCESQRADADRRRLDDLYRACTPVESEYAEGGEENE